jgi:hypothetical protein
MAKKIGRPPINAAGPLGRVFQIRLSDAEQEAYEQAAKRANRTLSAWIRERLSRAAKRESKRD